MNSIQKKETETGQYGAETASSSVRFNNVGQVSQPVLTKKPAESRKKMSESEVLPSNKKSNKKNTSFFENLFKPKPKVLKEGMEVRENKIYIIDGKAVPLVFA